MPHSHSPQGLARHETRILRSKAHFGNHYLSLTFNTTFGILKSQKPGMSLMPTAFPGSVEVSSFARPALPRYSRRAPLAIHKLWAMSSIVCLIALISVTSGPNFLACSKMLRGACVCSCCTRTRSLSAIVSWPCCTRLRHEHNLVLVSQAG